MPGANCSVKSYSSFTRSNGISIFNLLKKDLKFKDVGQEKWRNDMINSIIRDRVVDSDLRQHNNEDRLHLCEKHIQSDEMYYSKFIFNLYSTLAVFKRLSPVVRSR